MLTRRFVVYFQFRCKGTPSNCHNTAVDREKERFLYKKTIVPAGELAAGTIFWSIGQIFSVV